MSDRSSNSNAADSELDELPFQVRDYAAASRQALDRLRESQLSSAARFEELSQTIAMLDGLADRVHPRLGEKVRRLVAQVQRLGRLGPSSAADRHMEALLVRLAELEANPLWALPMPDESSALNPVGAVLRPGEIFADRVVSYSLGALRFCVRGELLFNIRGADLNRSYAVRAGQPPIAIFPHPERDSRAFPADAKGPGNHIMVFRAPDGNDGSARLLGLRYERILAIADHRAAEYERAMQPLDRPHPIVRGRIERRGRRHYVIGL